MQGESRAIVDPEEDRTKDRVIKQAKTIGEPLPSTNTDEKIVTVLSNQMESIRISKADIRRDTTG